MTDQRTLLAAYVSQGSEPAFRELVARYIDLVYSTAVRLVNGDTHRAEDVVQTVFADLARLAGTFSPDVMLGGWLHRRTWHVATTLMRSERRRQHRERQAVEMNGLNDQPGGQFERIAPLLDEAINQLGARDRAAIVQRFFEHRDLRTIGELLGSNEDAAQKRVSRAVEKLRCHFARRGIVASATVITSVITVHAVHAAPAGLASAVTTTSLAGAAGSSAFSLASTLTKIMLMKKTTVVISGAILVAAITSISAVKIKHARAHAPVTAASLREGLVLDMTFDQDEAGSGKIVDSSGHGNHGVAAGVHWTDQGRKGGAYEFTADGDEIVVTNNPSLNPTQVTLAAWIKTSTRDAIWRRIFDKSYSKGYALSIAGEWKGQKWNGLVSLEMGPGTHFSTTKTMVADGQWHQVVATFDGTEQQLYVDGKPEGGALRWKKPGQMGATDFNLVIGCNRSSVGDYDIGMSFRGLIDEPMMWNRALSTNEIAFLYQSQQQAAGGNP
ncbi:MAG: sigma-70 family RNA polymerase sigma factor [Verrucomicrobiia bacterium]